MRATLRWQEPPDLLLAATPAPWFVAAATQHDLLLLDHANCEKKAASTALSLMFSYAEDAALAAQLSRLAREELRHFEQVSRMMKDLGVSYRRLSPSRYAGGLRRVVAAAEPGRRLDFLLCGALIEARSCERFEGLCEVLADPLRGFYRGLAAAERRHFLLYLNLAADYAAAHGLDLEAQVQALAAVEAELITAPDPEFRFHSGCPLPEIQAG